MSLQPIKAYLVMVTMFMYNGKSVNNHVVITDSRGSYLQSYNTIVAHIDKKGKVFLSSEWNCSATTTKNVCRYLIQNGYCYAHKADINKAIKSGAIQVIEAIA